MTKSKNRLPTEESLILPTHPQLQHLTPAQLPIVDTHTHILSMYSNYCLKYPPPHHQFPTITDFARQVLLHQGVKKVVDVWCEAPMTMGWLDVVGALAGLEEEGFSYHFVVGAHPHAAKDYNETAASEITLAHSHPLCVGWGEIGLDYHYDNSPREEQKKALRSQLRSAVGSGLGKAITIHTREADDDIFTILTEELSVDQKIHVHCFTDTLELASKLLSHFPNLYIGITGVATYSTNLNTSSVLRHLRLTSPPPLLDSTVPSPLRILLETDSPYMVPSNMPSASLMKGMKSGQKLPFSTSAMIPWTAEFVAQVLNEGVEEAGEKWTTERVLSVARDNARVVYGI